MEQPLNKPNTIKDIQQHAITRDVEKENH